MKVQEKKPVLRLEIQAKSYFFAIWTEKKNRASLQRNGVLQHIILQSLLHISGQQKARRRSLAIWRC